MLLSQAIQYFLDARAGLAKKTLRINKQYLYPFLNYLGERDLSTITLYDLRQWRKHLLEKTNKYGGNGTRKKINGGLSHHTIHGHLRVLKQFFRWCHTEELIPTNPAARLEQVNISNQIPSDRIMSEETFQKLLFAARGNSPERIRDRALLWFFRHTGARLGGVARLELQDLHLDTREAEVIEKGKGGGRRRLVYFKAETVQALTEWLEMREALPQLCSNVFTTVPNQAGLGGGTPLSESSLYAIYYRMATRACVTTRFLSNGQRPTRFNPHAQRHAVAKRMLENGAPLPAVTKVLGHSRSSVTGDSYGRYEDHEAKRAHDQFA